MADAKEKAEPAPTEPAKAGKGNLILIIVIAVLGTLLIGGGITTVVLLKHDKSASASESSEETAKEDAPKAEAKKADKKKDPKKKEEAKGPAIYIPLEPPFVVNFDATQAVRFLQVSVEIMTRDAATASLIKENNPLVRNDLLLLFGNQDAAGLTAREGKEGLRKQTLEAVRHLVKAENGNPDLVEAVYFTSFVMQ